jgi:uncharacterized membrane protein YkoI
MTMKMRNSAWLLAVVVFSTLALVARADEEKIPLDKVPAKVLKAVQDKFPKAKLTGAVKEVENGKTTYEVSLKDGENAIDVSLKDDGTILVIEKAIAVKDLPKVVSEAVKAKYPKGTIKTAEELTSGVTVTYEVLVELDGKKPFEVVLDPKGKILEDEGKE